MKRLLVFVLVIAIVFVVLLNKQTSSPQHVMISTHVPHADVYINSNFIGKTPCHVYLEPGDQVFLNNRRFVEGSVHYTYNGEKFLHFKMVDNVFHVNGEPFGIYFSPMKDQLKLDIPKSQIVYVELSKDLTPLTVKFLKVYTNTKTLRCPRITEEGMKLLPQLSRLHGLDLENVKIANESFVALQQLDSLRFLRLWGTGLDSTGMKIVASLKLNCLDVWATDLSTENVALLQNSSDLHSLNLGYSKVSPDVLKSLAHLKNLKYLNVWGTELNNDSLQDLTAFPHLRYLNLRYTKVTDEGLQHLNNLKNLRMLFLSEANITEKGLKKLDALQKLETLNLWYTKTGNDFLSTNSWPNLTSLTVVGDSSFDNTGMSQLKSFRELRYLNLSGSSIDDKGLQALENNSFLTALFVDATKVTGEGLQYLKNTTTLRVLDLYNTKLNQQGWENLSHLKYLESLNVAHTQALDSHMIYIKDLDNLRYLNLGGNEVSYSGVRLLQDIQGLALMYVPGTQIHGNAVEELKKLFPHCNITR